MRPVKSKGYSRIRVSIISLTIILWFVVLLTCATGPDPGVVFAFSTAIAASMVALTALRKRLLGGWYIFGSSILLLLLSRIAYLGVTYTVNLLSGRDYDGVPFRVRAAEERKQLEYRQMEAERDAQKRAQDCEVAKSDAKSRIREFDEWGDRNAIAHLEGGPVEPAPRVIDAMQEAWRQCQ